MKIPYDIRPEGTESSLTHLASLHSQSAADYQQIADHIAPVFPAAADYFTELAAYRKALLEKLNDLIREMPGTAHTPSRTSTNVFRAEPEAFSKAANNRNIAYLADLTAKNENDTLKAYRHATANKKILAFAADLLAGQQDRVMEFVRRAERFRTVPQQRNLDVKTRSTKL